MFELLFEVIETAKGKYNYNIEDDDLTFALILIDYSIKKLFDDGTIGDDGNKVSVSLGGLFGARNARKFTEQAKHILKTQTVENRGQVAIVTHLGALAAYVDSLYAETTDSATKKENLVKLDTYIKSYQGKPYAAGIKLAGNKVLTDGKARLEGMMVS